MLPGSLTLPFQVSTMDWWTVALRLQRNQGPEGSAKRARSRRIFKKGVVHKDHKKKGKIQGGSSKKWAKAVSESRAAHQDSQIVATY